MGRRPLLKSEELKIEPVHEISNNLIKFSYFSTKTSYVVGTQKNRLKEPKDG